MVGAAKVGEEGSLVGLVKADESSWKEVAAGGGAVSHPDFVKDVGFLCEDE